MPRLSRSSLHGAALLAIVLVAFVPLHAAGPAFLVKEINTSTPVIENSYPRGYIEMNEHLFFFTRPYPGDGDLELWRSDGTPEGTTLVRELEYGYPSATAVVDGQLFFFAPDNLWVSDGSTSGTVNLERFQVHSDGAEIVELDGLAYFEGWDPDLGTTLWRSDGSPSGTQRFLSLPPRNLAVVDDELFFTVSTEAPWGNKDDLWKTDGTQTSRVIEWFESIRLWSLTEFQGQLVFAATSPGSGNGVWISDGTTAGTSQILALDSANSGTWPDVRFVEWGGQLYFYAGDATHGFELWRTDGTAAGTAMVVDLLPGPDSSSPCHLTPGPGGLIFTVDSVPAIESWSGCEFASNPSTNRQLWITDGTAAGTSFVTDAVPEPEDFLFTTPPIVELGGILYFGQGEYELWRTDGTAEGSWLVATLDANLPSVLTLPSLGVFDDRLWFTANDPEMGYELWTSGGTDVAPFKNLAPDLSHAEPELLGLVEERLLFSATDGAGDRALWVTDGTPDGTAPLAAIDVSPSRGVAELAGDLYFAEAESCAGFLWRSDGTPAGTVSLGAPTGCPNPREITAVDQKLLFSANGGGSDRELWRSDGVPNDWHLVTEINPDGSANPTHIMEFSARGYFPADDGETGMELWVSDGTAPGTALFKDLNPGPSGSYPRTLSTHGGFLYFSARAGQPAELGIWRTDGSSAGTTLVSNAPKPHGAFEALHALGDDLVFGADSTTLGSELWITDGTSGGTTVLRDIRPGAGGSSPTLLGTLDGQAYLTANDGSLGRELWKSDGTDAGTLLLMDIAPGRSGSSTTARLFASSPHETRAVFVASDGTHGNEIWQTAGTAETTTLMHDIRPGPASGVVDRRTALVADGLVYFVANDGVSGSELWAMPLFAPGEVADGSVVGGEPLRIAKADPTQLSLVWDASTCPAGTRDYAVYEGALGDPASSRPVTCSTEGLTSVTITPASGDRFYLVVPRNESTEGSYGQGSDSAERPVSPFACAVQWLDTVCEAAE